MKPVLTLIAAWSILILGGCGTVGVLEEENTQLQDKVDSLATVQHAMKQRVGYLEQENIKLDNRNKKLNDRLQESGSLTPPDYTVTDAQPRYAAPVTATAVPAQTQPQQQPESVQATPQNAASPSGTQAISPNPVAQPWRAEQAAIQSGAANPKPTGDENWTYNAQPGTATNGYTYKNDAQPGYTYKDDRPSVRNDGYTYNDSPRASSSGESRWQYNDNSAAAETTSKYAEKFDDNRSAGQPWAGRGTTPPPQHRTTPPATVASPQAAYERQAQQQMQRNASNPVVTVPPTQSANTPVAPLPPSQAHVSRSEAARKADYSFLAKYQKGLDAYKDRNYSESIRILTDLAATAEVNNTSDNCDFWIAESYYALRDYNSARVYYSRVVSFPRSDKADEASARLRQLR